MLKGFKNFVMRGNVIDLAVAVVMGAAFGAVVKALVDDVLMQIVAAVVGKPDFNGIVFTLNGTKFPIGHFLTAAVGFLLVALAIYVFVIVPMNALTARLKRGEVPPDPTTKKCPECLSEVPIAAKRCAFCTSALA